MQDSSHPQCVCVLQVQTTGLWDGAGLLRAGPDWLASQRRLQMERTPHTEQALDTAPGAGHMTGYQRHFILT